MRVKVTSITKAGTKSDLGEGDSHTNEIVTKGCNVWHCCA
jgi:hypothetical protein